MKKVNVTQDHFHASVHAADGVFIRMRNGDLIGLKATAQGWQLVDLMGRPIGTPCETAQALTRRVHSYS